MFETTVNGKNYRVAFSYSSIFNDQTNLPTGEILTACNVYEVLKPAVVVDKKVVEPAVRKVVSTGISKKVVADNFNRKEGRKYSLARAVCYFNREDRMDVLKVYFKMAKLTPDEIHQFLDDTRKILFG
jgi:hypothetical protein